MGLQEELEGVLAAMIEPEVYLFEVQAKRYARRRGCRNADRARCSRGALELKLPLAKAAKNGRVLAWMAALPVQNRRVGYRRICIWGASTRTERDDRASQKSYLNRRPVRRANLLLS